MIMTNENLIMEKSVANLALDNRTHRALERAGITTVAQLVDLDAWDLMDIRGFGQNCLVMVYSALGEWGLTLKPSNFKYRS
jgi:DNA-directed RNA polymerase alpha subunit